MKKVYKYPIPRANAKFSVMLPMGFKFLRVSFQAEQLFMWCEVTDGNLASQVNFQLFGTGQELNPNGRYLTTFDDGPFVFHLYQLG